MKYLFRRPRFYIAITLNLYLMHANSKGWPTREYCKSNMMVSNMRLSDLKSGNFKKLLFYLFTTVVSNVYISGCILARVIIFRYSCRELAAQQDRSLEIFLWLSGGGGGSVYPRPTPFFPV